MKCRDVDVACWPCVYVEDVGDADQPLYKLSCVLMKGSSGVELLRMGRNKIIRRNRKKKKTNGVSSISKEANLVGKRMGHSFCYILWATAGDGGREEGMERSHETWPKNNGQATALNFSIIAKERRGDRKPAASVDCSAKQNAGE